MVFQGDVVHCRQEAVGRTPLGQIERRGSAAMAPCRRPCVSPRHRPTCSSAPQASARYRPCCAASEMWAPPGGCQQDTVAPPADGLNTRAPCGPEAGGRWRVNGWPARPAEQAGLPVRASVGWCLAAEQGPSKATLGREGDGGGGGSAQGPAGRTCGVTCSRAPPGSGLASSVTASACSPGSAADRSSPPCASRAMVQPPLPAAGSSQDSSR